MAGWIIGYAMSLLSTFALSYLLAKVNDGAALKRWFGEGASTMLVAIPISIGTFFLWTMIGLVIGSVYELGEMGQQPNLLGSPSGSFLAGVTVVAVMPLPVLILLGRRFWWLWIGMSASFVGLFGWLMPLMAER
jgi:hypothetical protein